MRNKLFAAAIAATVVVLPTSALAAPAILVVDTDKILSECTACRAAGATIQGQINAGRTRAQQLQTQWQTEQKALETAVAALAGKQPDAALQQRVQRYQASRQQGDNELAQKENQIQSIQTNVQRQIAARVVQISEQSRARRQADIVIGKNGTLASNSANDITAEVLAAINQQLPSVSVTPLPQQQQPAAPAGR
ncbi:MAG: OmpH family outer membrane protein [Sphingomicrobium sp.]